MNDYKNKKEYDYKKEYNKNGKIADTIDEMMKKCNFEGLNKTVKKTIDTAFNEENIAKAVKTFSYVGGNISQVVNNEIVKYKNTYKMVDSGYNVYDYVNKPDGYIKYIVFQLIFYPLALLFLLLGIVFNLFSSSVAPFIVFVIFQCLGIFSSIKFAKIQKYKKYIKLFEKNYMLDIKTISNKLSISKDNVLKDLKYMIDRKIFREGHLVENSELIFINDEKYYEYSEIIREKIKREEHEQKIKNNKELTEFIEKNNSQIKEIKEIIDRISDIDTKNIIKSIIISVNEITNVVQKYPDHLINLNRFSNFYMPTTVKLIHSYDELNDSTENLDSVIKAKNEISNTLKTIDSAYKKLLNQIIKVNTMDINADISVLNTMLSQDGLKENDFNI
ncbi:5-bromo-4-chloroindolyl phosphate hydrolysis family protein [Peptostreptococcus canis]|uniref:5-bromo-4-chloroindolyl phosphate hydrolysis protein n=1 Tax=Peptostreptococcus canis TaxID=1159213 RepID=A0ABR6TK10_9FIRM|nr:5-bromo-4-chloroindolyl phosphate hydrolysis family protein [Peptostreptococcus canis]MBC2575735.1 hypothetical protein [Peptostreptococcus canis]MBP1998150.1 hypothetical protein [Peptostreptococcus canis]